VPIAIFNPPLLGIIRGYVIVQDGQLVAEGYDLDHDENNNFEAYGVTKSLISAMFGKMVMELQVVSMKNEEHLGHDL
jgi:hypothetical protein